MPGPPPLKPKSNARKSGNAWGMAVANQLALPGLGTVMAGRKIGYVQLTFSIIGVLLTTSFLVWAVPRLGDWLKPPEDDAVILANFKKWVPWFAIAGAGIVSFVIGWFMALISSQSIIREQSTRAKKR